MLVPLNGIALVADTSFTCGARNPLFNVLLRSNTVFTLGLLLDTPTCARTAAPDKHNKVVIIRMYIFMLSGSRD